MNEIANNLSEMPAIRYPPFIVRSTAGHRKGSHLKYAEVCNESASVLTPWVIDVILDASLRCFNERKKEI